MPHAWQLGWSAVREFNATTLPRGRTVNVSLASQSAFAASLLPIRNGLRVVPSWAAGGEPMWMSFRTRTRGDLGLLSGYENRVHIHTSALADPLDSAFTTWEAMLPGEQAGGGSCGGGEPWRGLC